MSLSAHSPRPKTRIAALFVAVIATVIVATACGDSASNSPADAENPSALTQPPHVGGTLVVGVYKETAGLDPIVTSSSGNQGGDEAVALYDTIMRWDSAKRQYQPRTANSLTNNASFTEFTLKLKPNIKFTDGTAYDAQAVKTNIERHIAPTSRSVSKSALQTYVSSITVVDPMTVKFTLTRSWPGFPYLLTQNAGMIASPTAIEKAGQNFNVAPGDAGAGPFKLVSYKPGEALQLRRNDAYYGGQVYLDEIRFVPYANDRTRLDALKAGAIQATVMRGDAAAIAEARAFPTIDMPINSGVVLAMNNGVTVTCKAEKPAPLCVGQADGSKVKTNTPTADVRVRKAIVAAIDPKIVNERVYGGAAIPGTALFPPGHPLDPGVPGPVPNAAEARRLVVEAKQAGWNGKIRLLVGPDEVQGNLGLALKTQLEAVGFQVDLIVSQNTATQVISARDFDLTTWAFGLYDDDGNHYALYTNLHSSSDRFGYNSPDMDQALDALSVASTEDAKRDAYKRIAQTLYRDAPAAIIATSPQVFAHSKSLSGVARSANGQVLFDGASLER